VSILLPAKWIAARVEVGTTKDAKAVVHHLAQAQRQGKSSSEHFYSSEVGLVSSLTGWPRDIVHWEFSSG